jgi:hypothetical protein
MTVCAVLSMAVCGPVLGLVSAYHVEPVKAAWSGWINRGDSVSEVITCNFDELDSASGGYVELFAGFHGAGANYHLGIYEYPGGQLVASRNNLVPGHDHTWLKFDRVHMEPGEAFTKGRKYEFRFTRSGSDSINYYYDSACGYGPYGQMIAPYPPIITPSYGLAMRAYGRMKPVDSTYLSVQIHSFALDTGLLYPALRLAHDSLGVRWVGDDLGHWDRWSWDTAGVRRRCSTYAAMGYQVRGYLAYGLDSVPVSSRGNKPGDTFPRASYPPRGLFADLTADTNYWARYCDSIMKRLPGVRYWAVWGEPNACWNWHDPDKSFYGTETDSVDTPRERCSLYVRMCNIAKQTALTLGHGQKVIGGYVYRLLDPDGLSATGVDWLRDMFDLAEEDSFGGVANCFDIIAVDPYMHVVSPGKDMLWFNQAMFDADLDTARAVMRAAGYPGFELWVTEMGWPRWDKHGPTAPPRSLTDTLLQARNLCQFLVSAQARRADPRGGYDRVNWYELTAQNGGIASEGLGLLDTTLGVKPLPQWWSAEQVNSILLGKRLNGRVTTGDSAIDNHTRMYEFEDPTSLKKTWVCWSDEDTAPPTTFVNLPVRTDTTQAESLAYNSAPPTYDRASAATGWLLCTLYNRPVFITEPASESISRPDLVVDSVRYVPPPSDTAALAWVTNRGSRSTPHQDGGRPYPTWAMLYANGDSLAELACNDSIPKDSSVVFEFARDAVQTPQMALLSVQVNPGQSYVELSTDDNAGHARFQLPGAVH